MAELAASTVVGPLVSLLKEKVSNHLLDQYKVMEGMEKQHKILERKLPAILDIMADAEKQASYREGVKAWLEELKAVAYEANDVFDEFQYEALRRKAKKEGHITKLGVAGVKLFPTHNRLVFRSRMGNKISSIVEAIEVLVAKMNAFGFKHQLDGAPAWREWRETDHMIVDHEDIVSRSRKKEKEKIIETLLSGQPSTDGDLMVVPIVGMGGLGKTTLAQLIYNDPRVQEHFQPLKWVCVSDDFNVCSLANKVSNASETSLEEALKKLQDELMGKRYLLVLDDIWNKDEEKWKTLKACLKHGGVGSAILTTTRDKEIAGFMGTVVVDNSCANKYHDMAVLGKEFIEEIIETRAFNPQENKKDELVNLVGPIAEKCVGSPLAAKALGSVLRNKTTKEEWDSVLHQSSICNHETGILPILKLSYDDLPSDLRQCFAFCALYPKDDKIDMHKLIQLWIANGFISDQKNISAETMGEQIVKQMVSRSFFEYVDKDPFFEYTSFEYDSTTLLKMHDLMHDVAVFASEKECVCIRNENEMIQSGEFLPSSTRHLHSTKTNKQRLAIFDHPMKSMSLPIQTLLVGSCYSGDVKHLSKYSKLRALSMPYFRSHHGNFPIQPKHMRHLRYLDISGSDIKALPEDISILYNLQTLKLSGCRELSGLPKEMKYMSSLRHLYTNGCKQLECMPPGLGRLTSLRTVTCFVVGSDSDCSTLGELKNLNIGGSLKLKQLENVAETADAEAANLENKKDLRQLSLSWTNGKEEEKQCHEVLEALKAHDGLLALKIASYQGASFPLWVGTLKRLVDLELCNCGETERLPPLCQLAELRRVRLEGLKKLQFLCSHCTSSTFGKLKDLELNNLDDFGSFFQRAVEGEVVAFPQLEMLYIRGCKNLTSFPEAAVLKGAALYVGGDYTMARSAFPQLKRLIVEDLARFERWEPAALGSGDEAVQQELFPSLESAEIKRCPQLMTLPGKAPKLRELVVVWEVKQETLSPLVAAGYMTSLSTLIVGNVKLDGMKRWDHTMSSTVTFLGLDKCDGFFSQSPSRGHALSLWACLGQKLQHLCIWKYEELVYWPEEEFLALVPLRGLDVSDCDNLIGYAPPDHQQAATSSESERSQLLPCLESLWICDCKNLVEIFNNNSPALKRLVVENCGKVECLSGVGKQQQDEKTPSGPSADAKQPPQEQSSPSESDIVIINLLPSSLETLTIWDCHGLSEVRSLPSSLGRINIRGCPKLRSLSGQQLDALTSLEISGCPELRSLESCMIDQLSAVLERLLLRDCRSLACLPSGSQAYSSSLRRLEITECPRMKSPLPPALRQRLHSMEDKDLDARYEQGLLGRLCSRLSLPRLC